MRKPIFILLLFSAIMFIGACNEIDDESDDFSILSYFSITGYFDSSGTINKFNSIHGLCRQSGNSVVDFFYASERNYESDDSILKSITFSAARVGTTQIITTDINGNQSGILTITVISNGLCKVYYNNYECICSKI